MTDFALLANGRYRDRRADEQPVGIVIHTAETYNALATSGDTAAERVTNYGKSPGCRVSWHATVDTDSIIWCLPETKVAWHAALYNTKTLGLEIACSAHDWKRADTSWVDLILTNAARVVGFWCARHGIEPVRTSAQVRRSGKAGEVFCSGIFGHMDTTPLRVLRGRGGKGDPGHNFPWLPFMRRVVEVRDHCLRFGGTNHDDIARRGVVGWRDAPVEASAQQQHPGDNGASRPVNQEDFELFKTSITERLGRLESAHHHTHSRSIQNQNILKRLVDGSLSADDDPQEDDS